MRKLFKKSLACLLAALLCVTVFAGVLSVNAATPTYSTNAVSAKAGEKATITLTINDFATTQGVLMKLTLPDAIASVDAVKIGDRVLPLYDPEEGNGYYKVDGKDLTFLSLFGAELGELDSYDVLVLDIDVTFADEIEAGEYNITNPVFQLSDGEVLFDVTGSFGAITVEEEEVEPPTPEEPEELSSLSLGRQIFVGSVIGMYYLIPQKTYEAYDDYYIEVIAEKYDANYNRITADPVIFNKKDTATVMNGYNYYLYDGSAGYELLLNITATVYCKKDGKVVAKSSAKTDTLAGRIMNGVTSAGGNTKALALYVDSVNYGTEAEKYFASKYPNSDLAKASAHANDGFDAYQQYATAVAPVAQNINATSYPYAGSSETAKIGKQAQIKSSNVLAYTPVVGSHNAADLYIKISYTNSYDELKKAIVRVSDSTQFDTSGYYSFDQIALYDLNQPVTASIYEDGNDVALVTNIYSIESAVASNKTPEANDIFDAIMKVGYSARAYFNFD